MRVRRTTDELYPVYNLTTFCPHPLGEWEWCLACKAPKILPDNEHDIEISEELYARYQALWAEFSEVQKLLKYLPVIAAK